MKMRTKFLSVQVTLVLIAILFSGCAKKSYLDVQYQLPEPKHTFKGKTVVIQVKDSRENQETFSDDAKEKFKDFSGLFSLTMKDENNAKKLLGTFELPLLFREALKNRLKSMEIDVRDYRENQEQVFKIVINNFYIYLSGRNWVADVAYEVSLVKDDQIIARESVSGTAQRLNLMGNREAEKVVGEIFSEIINKLNVRRLFEQTMN